MDSIEERLNAVRDKLSVAEREAGRAPGSAQLIVVSKTFHSDDIQPVLDLGQRMFGENRVQESQGKWPELKSRYSGVELHMIGPLQSNKTAEAVALFDVIQTVDREKVAKEIAKEMKRQKRVLKLFVQVNTGEEIQKAGIGPTEAVEFVSRCREVHGLEIDGLMCIPPYDENPGPHFALLRQIAEEAGVRELSMGMSGDYEIAVQFGATQVRVGSAIFGSRS